MNIAIYSRKRNAISIFWFRKEELSHYKYSRNMTDELKLNEEIWLYFKNGYKYYLHQRDFYQEAFHNDGRFDVEENGKVEIKYGSLATVMKHLLTPIDLA